MISVPVTCSYSQDRTNAENDALLHKLVHTRLLSGSLDSDLNIKSADRRKALTGRVRELTGEIRLGKGEKAVRYAERNKAGKRVREGLALKQKEREKQELEEVCADLRTPLAIATYRFLHCKRQKIWETTTQP